MELANEMPGLVSRFGMVRLGHPAASTSNRAKSAQPRANQRRIRVDAGRATIDSCRVKLSYRLCPLSAKRLAMLEEDPDLVNDLAESEIPDLLDLGPEGFELDGILLFTGRDPAVRDAVFAQTGRDLGEVGEGVRVHTPERVAEIHAALSKLPPDVIARCFEPARRAMPRLATGPAAIARFAALHERLCATYAKAAANAQGMLTFLV